MAQNSTSDQIKLILDTSLNLAKENAWETVTLQQIATSTGLSKTDVEDLIQSKNNILHLLIAQIDAKLLQNCSGNFSESDTAKDRIFEVVIERFDLLNENRAAIKSIYKSLLKGFIPAPETFLIFRNSMMVMLEIAEVLPHKTLPTNELHIKGLALIYLATMRVWVKDESDDLSATMASLDKHLSQADKVLKYLPLAI